MFDADLTGAVLNMQLLRRLLKWMKPYRYTFIFSAILILIASTLAVLLPVILCIVVIDHIIRGETELLSPDLGMISATEWLASSTGLTMLLASCALYAVVQIAWAVAGH